MVKGRGWVRIVTFKLCSEEPQGFPGALIRAAGGERMKAEWVRFWAVPPWFSKSISAFIQIFRIRFLLNKRIRTWKEFAENWIRWSLRFLWALKFCDLLLPPQHLGDRDGRTHHVSHHWVLSHLVSSFGKSSCVCIRTHMFFSAERFSWKTSCSAIVFRKESLGEIIFVSMLSWCNYFKFLAMNVMTTNSVGPECVILRIWVPLWGITGFWTSG